MVNDFNGVNLIDAQPQSRVQQWKKLPKCTITGEHGGKPLFKYRLAEDVKKKIKAFRKDKKIQQGISPRTDTELSKRPKRP